MRRLPVICIFISICIGTMAAQVTPKSNGSCGVAASGVESCDWMSAIDIRKDVTTQTTERRSNLVHDSDLFVTTYILAPGAPLDSRGIVGGEVLIVGRNNGEVVNEKKSPPAHINVFENLVMLMPKKEPYLLRNVGKDNVELLLIEIRKKTSKPNVVRSIGAVGPRNIAITLIDQSGPRFPGSMSEIA